MARWLAVGSALAATRQIIATTGRGSRRSRRGCWVGSHLPDRDRHTLDLRLAELGVERQGEGAPSDVLADRELPFAVAEALAVEAQQVDRRQVGLGVDAALAQSGHCRVALHLGRKLHDVHEPASPVSALVGAGQTESLDVGERLRVERCGPCSLGKQLVQALELGEADGTAQIVEPVVEAESVVVEPAHVRRAALVALAVYSLLERLRGSGHGATLPGRQLLVRIEAERREVAAGADRR